MIAKQTPINLRIVFATAAIVMMSAPIAAQAASTTPFKELFSSRIGWEVDKTTKGKICTVVSKDECQLGAESTEPGGFKFTEGLSVNNDPTKTSTHYGDVYVVDRGNARVQELTATGVFVSMFGWDVNKTKVAEGGLATQIEKNVCSAISGDSCQAGVRGTAGGQFADAYSVAVDPATGDVYVQEQSSENNRVDKFTAEGLFVWTIGKEVDETTHADICTAVSGDRCKGGVKSSSGITQPGSFNFRQFRGDLLAVGGLEDLLYAGDEGRIQEFTGAGQYKREIQFGPNSRISALAVNNSCLLHQPVLTEITTPTCKEFDPSNGAVYAVSETGFTADVIQQFDSNGAEVKDGHFPLTVSARQAGASVHIDGMALDSNVGLAVTATEEGPATPKHGFGSLYDESTGRLITEFVVPAREDSVGIAFGSEGGLYAAVQHEVLTYASVPVGELIAKPALCVEGAEHETDETLNCTLNGEVNPEEVPATKVWFQYGQTCSLGSESPPQPIPTGGLPVPVTFAVAEVLPNVPAFCFRLVGEDANVEAPELLTSEKLVLTTPIVAPKIIGDPSVSFVKATSAVMSGELNPENARTEYFFEYGTGAALADCLGGVRAAKGCAGVNTTPVQETSCPIVNGAADCTYKPIIRTLEASGLEPSTTYHYRLFAESENAVGSERRASTGTGLQEGSFTTASAAPQVETGPPSAVMTTSAIVSGVAEPNGQPSVYTFELGVFKGVETRFGVVLSASAGSGLAPVEEAFTLSGLQPGTIYAYRIVIASPYGTVDGATRIFTTEGLSEAFSVSPPPQLLTPPIKFPGGGKPLTRAQQLANAMKACAKKPKSKRAVCRRNARKRYGATVKKANESHGGAIDRRR